MSRLLQSQMPQAQAAGPIAQRQPQTHAATVTDNDRREFIRDTILFFNRSAAFFGDPAVKMDRSRFDRVINGLYSAVVAQEQIIDTNLRRDAALKRDLRAAYIAVIRVLIAKAAAALHRTEDDLLRENTGRIPMWAWPTPHRTVRNITTPIEEGRRADRSGRVRFASNGVSVTILPDRTVRALKTAARTEADMRWSSISYTHQPQGQQIVTSFSGPRAPTLRIQTTYRRGSGPGTTSAYGRGTTPQDLTGGAVSRRSTTLGFHEGSHGLAFVEFVKNHPPPQFTGAVGMTKADFDAADAQYRREANAYMDDLLRFSTQQVDCVGTTIDQHNQANAARGATIVVECVP
jgi:hypothetical protein